MLFRASVLFAAASAAAAATPENICGANTTLGQHVMAALNLSYPGLEAVAEAEASGDLNAACEALSAYYLTSNTSAWLRVPPVAPGTGRVGNGSLVDNAVDFDLYYLAGVTTSGKIPRNADGGLDWLDKGPRNDVEFMNCLNRFDVLGWLLAAWRATGNPVYPKYFNALVIDWTTHNPCPDARSGGAACSPQGVTTSPQCAWGVADVPSVQACATGTFESPWRSLEMGIRTNGVFADAFFGFQGAAEFSTSARALLVLAMGEPNQALAVDGGHAGRGTPNWELGQWAGLITSTVNFPELKNASGLRAQALAELEALLASVVYPDGVETEMASGYDMWTAAESLGVLRTLALGGDAAPPAAFAAHVEQMWQYGSYITDPALCLPRNGDSDLCGSGYDASAAAYFQRQDWTWIATRGQAGAAPALPDGPSAAFPWAGQLALRSGFDAAATWAFFDVGPYGSSGHAHRDKLHLNIHAKGAMLLVDSGRFAYAGTDLSNTLHTQYGPFAFAHNTLTLDGADQLPTPATVAAPMPAATYRLAPAADWAFGNMSAWDATLKGSATHTRAVYYQRAPAAAAAAATGGSADGDFLLVVDVLASDRPRTVEATWHAHPNGTVDLSAAPAFVAAVGGADWATGRPAAAQACVIPASGAATWASAAVVMGVMQNATEHFQGWYSQSYDDADAAPTLVYRAPNTPDGAVFAWLIVPQSARGPCTDSAEVVAVSSTSVTIHASVAGSLHIVSVPVASSG